ncbi:efflux RND transporter periplasmic adaptor subunit [Rapidithrix thailandica]|uniref:Efflux RND transporter periplasmic adaptor subunit n=1 Tax=Rapidithrix thailandica TaxID=413964 RepID=A0AAW9SBD8_9BACT
MKKVAISIFVLGAIALVAFTLQNNKKEIQEEAKLADITSEAIPVELIHLQVDSSLRPILTTGTFEPSLEIQIVAEAQGKITQKRKRKGEKIRQGQLLATVDNERLKANLLVAEANFEKATRDLQRFEKLIETEAITQRQLEEARLAHKNAQAQLISSKKAYNDTFIKAPANGILNEDYFEKGSYVSPGQELYDLVNTDLLYLNVKVPERDILYIANGQKVLIHSKLFPEKTLEGTVKSVAAKADKSLNYNIEVAVKNTSSLKGGMFVEARFIPQSNRAIHTLPRQAIVGSVKKPTVFVVKEGKAFEKPVVIGASFEGQVEIISGLSEQDQVVLSGQINLKEGTPVKKVTL